MKNTFSVLAVLFPIALAACVTSPPPTPSENSENSQESSNCPPDDPFCGEEDPREYEEWQEFSTFITQPTGITVAETDPDVDAVIRQEHFNRFSGQVPDLEMLWSGQPTSSLSGGIEQSDIRGNCYRGGNQHGRWRKCCLEWGGQRLCVGVRFLNRTGRWGLTWGIGRGGLTAEATKFEPDRVQD